jgi:signal transduction histidine kinase
MPQARESSLPTGFVLVCGDADGASTLVSTLAADGFDAVHAETPPEALATLDAAAITLLVVVEDGRSHPEDLFGAAARRGHRLPGLYVGTETRTLPPGVEQVPAVSEAAAAVRQRLLAEAADDAESVVAEDPLSAFGLTVSHELRNHLGAAKLAIDSLEGPTVEQARSALDRLEGLAAEAEAVASKDVGSTDPVSLADAADAAADRLRIADATVDIDAAGEVDADRDLLVLLLENLLRNAVEHGGEELTVRVVDTDTGFAVVDDGPGFGTADPFAWGYTTGEGQGAGLAIVQRVADAHDWQVSASDDDGARIDVDTR